ncbi:hypothetical protein V6N13_097487 [Hibiscus sabdariffa]
MTLSAGRALLDLNSLLKKSILLGSDMFYNRRSIFGRNTKVFDSELGVRQSVLIHSLWLKQARQGVAVQKLQAQYQGSLHPETKQA